MLADVLKNPRADASDRLIAAELAGDSTIVGDELVDLLLSVLLDNQASAELRGTAAISLGTALEIADMDDYDDFDDPAISEEMFLKVKTLLGELYGSEAVPDNVRRNILEASVRVPEDWHRQAVRAAYAHSDPEWKLTAVFAMRWVGGFEAEIMEALNTSDEALHYQAVCAAGAQEVSAAWSHVARLVCTAELDKSLLLAAIDAVAQIRPHEAGMLLVGLMESNDEDIVAAAYEATAMAEAQRDFDEFDELDGNEDSADFSVTGPDKKPS
jgi:hypothetical protein